MRAKESGSLDRSCSRASPPGTADGEMVVDGDCCGGFGMSGGFDAEGGG